jgi:mycothiol synthase
MPNHSPTHRDASRIPGLHFRPLREEADALALLEVRQACLARDPVDPLSCCEAVPTGESIAAAVRGALQAGDQDRWVLAEIGGRTVVGYEQLEEWTERDGTRVLLLHGWVAPEWRRKGIGTALLRRAERTALRLACRCHPGERLELAAHAGAQERGAARLLGNEGYSVAYTVLEMGRDAPRLPPAPALPAGMETRAVLPEHAVLIADSVGEAYRSELPGGRFQQVSEPARALARLSAPGQDPRLWQVAWDGDQIAGQVLSSMERGRAEIFEVGVRPPWRRRGIARSLLVRALRCLSERGVDEVRLQTAAESQTRAAELFRSLGFRVIRELSRYRKAPPSSSLRRWRRRPRGRSASLAPASASRLSLRPKRRLEAARHQR